MTTTEATTQTVKHTHPSGITVTSERRSTDITYHYIDGRNGHLGGVLESTSPYCRHLWVSSYAPPAGLGDAIGIGEYPTLDNAINAILRVDAVVRKAREAGAR